MLERTVKEATELAARHARKPATEMLEEGAIRIARQTTGTPGKFRWIVQKTFPDAIGTAGERVLRIVIDQSGRIVSAFPADRLLAIGIGVGALVVLDARTAAASERTREYAARDAAKEDDVSWWEFVPIIGDLWGGELNAGEDEEIRRERELSAEIASTIAAIEDEETRCLTAEERQVRLAPRDTTGYGWRDFLPGAAHTSIVSVLNGFCTWRASARWRPWSHRVTAAARANGIGAHPMWRSPPIHDQRHARARPARSRQPPGSHGAPSAPTCAFSTDREPEAPAEPVPRIRRSRRGYP